jgi:hypothetical protein
LSLEFDVGAHGVIRSSQVPLRALAHLGPSFCLPRTSLISSRLGSPLTPFAWLAFRHGNGVDLNQFLERDL